MIADGEAPCITQPTEGATYDAMMKKPKAKVLKLDYQFELAWSCFRQTLTLSTASRYIGIYVVEPGYVTEFML